MKPWPRPWRRDIYWQAAWNKYLEFGAGFGFVTTQQKFAWQ
jgi:hypothetical protein